MSDLFAGLSSFTKSVNDALNSYEMRKIGDKVQSFVLNFTEVELKVRDATNEDPWGPTGPQMQEIAQLTFQYDAFPEIMGMIWKRMLQDNKLAWRRVYKSLILLNNLLKTGSERVISNAKDRLFEMRTLESYNCVDERGRDQGVNIRHRVKQIIELLQDDELLMHERQKTRSENKEKYQGYSKEDMLYKGKVSSFESWNEKKFSSKSNDFDFPESRRDREVSSYDFDQNRSASPELGIPDNAYHRHQNPPSAANNDDDEFGDFADARSSSQQPATNNSTHNNDLFGDFSSSPTKDLSNNRVPKPPSVPTSPVPKSNNQPAAQTNVGNLFDFDSNDVQPAAPVSNHNNGFDLFGGPPAPATQTPQANNVDIFGDFNAPTPTANPVQNARPNNDFDIFGDFNAPSNAPVTNSVTPGGWGDLVMPTPVQQSKPAQEKAPEPKLDDGWNFLEKQLDGLTLGNKQKAAPTMNEMRSQK